MRKFSVLLLTMVAFGSSVSFSTIASAGYTQADLRPFPAGYIDSPFVMPDESAIYFIHSPAATIDMLTANPEVQPVTASLPGHQASDSGFWWNTDIYVSHRSPDGTWGEPENLGAEINTENLEGGPWLNDEQTTLIFMRESVTDPSLSGAFMATRPTANDPWGIPERLPGVLGTYAIDGYTDFHLVPSGNLYFWSEMPDGNGTLYWAQSTGENEWSAPQRMPEVLHSDKDESQPWVNDAETEICFNRRGDDGNTQLLCSTRADPGMDWSAPDVIPIAGIADANGATVWGEPSFAEDGTMYFVRFDTADPQWPAELMLSRREADGGYGMPEPLVFG